MFKRTGLALLLTLSLSVAACAEEGALAPDEMTGIKIGEKAPDFTLKDQNGVDQTLSALLAGDDTVVLNFFRSARW